MTRAGDRLRLLTRPFGGFFRLQPAAAVVLVLAAAVSLAWTNSPWGRFHVAWTEFEVAVGAGGLAISKPVLLWINDLLMAVFFLLAGLELKREIMLGELSTLRKAALPAIAAVGGMVAPALVFFLLAPEAPASRGWGIPMAADTAFALGCLRLLGRRVPSSLLVFFTALAIIDDLGAILVVALFYRTETSWVALVVAGGVTAALVAMNQMGVRRASLYVVVGAPLWVAVLESGVHPTVAGIVIAFCIPARARFSRQQVLERARELLALAETPDSKESDAALEALERRLDDCKSPLSRLEDGLAPWVLFGIVPLFALANVGIPLREATLSSLLAPPSMAIVLGLFLGNQLGVSGAIALAVRAGLSSLPEGMTWRHVYGMSLLTGIGFTMSLLIASVAYAHGSPMLAEARVAILAGSTLSGASGLLVLGLGRRATRMRARETDLAKSLEPR